MTFTTVIETHRLALLRLVAMLFEASGLGPGKPALLPWIIRGAVLHSLRPMEAAGRRLVVTMAHLLKRGGFVATLHATRGKPTGPIPRGTGEHVPAFSLFDPRRRVGVERARYAKHGPRMFFFDGTDPVYEPAAEPLPSLLDEPVDAARLCQRLQALKTALDDLPKQARRLIRAEARRAKIGKGLIGAMRPGRPPGHRSRGKHEADDILSECHQLALMALSAPDTS